MNFVKFRRRFIRIKSRFLKFLCWRVPRTDRESEASPIFEGSLTSTYWEPTNNVQSKALILVESKASTTSLGLSPDQTLLAIEEPTLDGSQFAVKTEFLEITCDSTPRLGDESPSVISLFPASGSDSVSSDATEAGLVESASALSHVSSEIFGPVEEIQQRDSADSDLSCFEALETPGQNVRPNANGSYDDVKQLSSSDASASDILRDRNSETPRDEHKTGFRAECSFSDMTVEEYTTDDELIKDVELDQMEVLTSPEELQCQVDIKLETAIPMLSREAFDSIVTSGSSPDTSNLTDLGVSNNKMTGMSGKGRIPPIQDTLLTLAQKNRSEKSICFSDVATSVAKDQDHTEKVRVASGITKSASTDNIDAVVVNLHVLPMPNKQNNHSSQVPSASAAWRKEVDRVLLGSACSDAYDAHSRRSSNSSAQSLTFVERNRSHMDIFANVPELKKSLLAKKRHIVTDRQTTMTVATCHQSNAVKKHSKIPRQGQASNISKEPSANGKRVQFTDQVGRCLTTSDDRKNAKSDCGVDSQCKNTKIQQHIDHSVFPRSSFAERSYCIGNQRSFLQQEKAHINTTQSLQIMHGIRARITPYQPGNADRSRVLNYSRHCNQYEKAMVTNSNQNNFSPSSRSLSHGFSLSEDFIARRLRDKQILHESHLEAAVWPGSKTRSILKHNIASGFKSSFGKENWENRLNIGKIKCSDVSSDLASSEELNSLQSSSSSTSDYQSSVATNSFTGLQSLVCHQSHGMDSNRPRNSPQICSSSSTSLEEAEELIQHLDSIIKPLEPVPKQQYTNLTSNTHVEPPKNDHSFRCVYQGPSSSEVLDQEMRELDDILKDFDKMLVKI